MSVGQQTVSGPLFKTTASPLSRRQQRVKRSVDDRKSMNNYFINGFSHRNADSSFTNVTIFFFFYYLLNKTSRMKLKALFSQLLTTFLTAS